MTDWATAPPGPELDAAVARLMGWIRQQSHSGDYWQCPPEEDGNYAIIRASDWQPSRGDLDAAFQVMAARKGWYWKTEQWEEAYIIQLDIIHSEKSIQHIFDAVYYDEPGVDGDRRKAFCLAVCRAAMMAVEGEENAHGS